MSAKSSRTLQLAVVEFALPSPRTGSIETYSGYGPLPDVGAEIHARIQADRLRTHPVYIPERWISHTLTRDRHKLVIGGRMDGFISGSPPLIEEIKTAYNIDALLSALQRNLQHPYRLQLLTYMYFYFLQTDTIPRGTLHVVCARTGRSTDIEVMLDPQEVGAWFDARVNELIAEDQSFEKIKERRKKAASGFVFPFENPRKGQKELMATVEKHLGNEARLLLQAPTGLGKTAAISFPNLKEAMSRGQKALYLTAKNSQHEVAEDAVRRIQQAGARVKAVTIHAKSKMCLKDETFCNPEYCEYARDYYTKVSQADLIAKLGKKKNLTAPVYKKAGREHQVCPFELQLDTVHHADMVICDYNYVFSPRSALGTLTRNGFGKSGLPNLIVDEAHNLPSRAQDYFSARLSMDELSTLLENSRHLDADLLSAMSDLTSKLRERFKDIAEDDGAKSAKEVKLDWMDFSDLFGRSQELLSRYLAVQRELLSRDPVLDYCNQIAGFAESLTALNDEFFCTYIPSAQGGALKITCCDASPWLREVYKKFANTTLFSATLKPFDYYARLLGVDGEQLVNEEFPSPFPRQNRKLMIIPQVSTKMRDRLQNYGKIASGIERIVSIRKGNYFVFFPSFDFLYNIASRLNLPDFELITQKREMRREAVNEVLEKLRAQERPTLILAVQGGVFAEGVDYPGEMLIGAIVVGPALPTFDFERELLRRYYDLKHEGHGFDYAYTFPAMAKVVQSAGRVIRSNHDRGLIVLMDRRFTHENYVKSMPSDWISGGLDDLLSQSIVSDIEDFWKAESGEA